MEYANAKILDKRAESLQGAGGNITSQFGEDGFIAAALKRIEPVNRWCFEVGAGDGKALSNTWSLRQDDWNAVLIESDEERANDCLQYVSDRVAVYHEHIGPESLDRILAYAGAPVDLDFGSIDIDGQDYYVWQGMTIYQPRLMLVEFSPYGKEPENFLPELDGIGQAGINQIVKLGREKGYFPMLSTAVNVLFCREDAWR